MNKILWIVFTFTSVFGFAETFLFEPYVDAQYGCNYLEGLNWRIPVEAATPEEAARMVSGQIGQKLTVGCNRDIYQCVHKDGDVQPRPISFSTEERNLMVIGGQILNSEGKHELLQIGTAFFHRNLRPIPKCKW